MSGSGTGWKISMFGNRRGRCSEGVDEVQNEPGTQEFEVIVKDLARVKERVFKFDAFVKSGGM